MNPIQDLTRRLSRSFKRRTLCILSLDATIQPSHDDDDDENILMVTMMA